MKKLFISCPMRGKTESEIFEARAKLKRIAEAYEGEELEVITSYNPEYAVMNRIDALGKSISYMAQADIFIGVVVDTQKYPGAFIEDMVAEKYHIPRYFVDYTDIFDYDDEGYEGCASCSIPEV